MIGTLVLHLNPLTRIIRSKVYTFIVSCLPHFLSAVCLLHFVKNKNIFPRKLHFFWICVNDQSNFFSPFLLSTVCLHIFFAGNGGWGDHRDRALCMNMAKFENSTTTMMQQQSLSDLQNILPKTKSVVNI